MYHEPVFRPPAEADSLIVQAATGCSYNRCRFCAMYKRKKFRVLTEPQLQDHLAELRGHNSPDIRRCFIADGDALCLKIPALLGIIATIRNYFPAINRFGIYGSVFSLADKTAEDLRRLRNAGLHCVYFGIESGDPAVLRTMNKYTPIEDIITAGKLVMAAGIKLSVTVIIGLGGISGSDSHIRASSAVVNALEPTYTSVLNLMFSGNTLQSDHEYGSFSKPDYCRELAQFISLITCRTVFRSNHASNYLPLAGNLPQDRDRLLAEISKAG